MKKETGPTLTALQTHLVIEGLNLLEAQYVERCQKAGLAQREKLRKNLIEIRALICAGMYMVMYPNTARRK